MAKKKEILENEASIESTDLSEVDIAVEEAPTKVVLPKNKAEMEYIKPTVVEMSSGKGLINCLRKEKIEVRLIPKKVGVYSNPRHVLYGGMAEEAMKTFCVPLSSSGFYVKVLTDEEEAFLEYTLGLAKGDLSVYKNFWDCSNDLAVVKLTKASVFLDLSNPRDYIKYKILLANKDKICPSQKELEERPLPTYMFVIIGADEEIKSARRVISSIQEAYKEFGKIEDNKPALKTVVEYLSGRPVASTAKLDFLQVKVNEYIQNANGKEFLKLVKDNLFHVRVLINRAIEAGLISKKGNYYYLRENSMPLCEMDEEPTLEIAMRFLSSPKNQDIKFGLEAKLQ